jgi:hypothetical protein
VPPRHQDVVTFVIENDRHRGGGQGHHVVLEPVTGGDGDVRESDAHPLVLVYLSLAVHDPPVGSSWRRVMTPTVAAG